MMVDQGMADAFISGISRNYPSTLRPALQIIGTEEGVDKVAGMFILNTKKGTLFLADTTININPTDNELANIAMLTAKTVRRFNVVPRLALFLLILPLQHHRQPAILYQWIFRHCFY